jgi:hypothetical protein
MNWKVWGFLCLVGSLVFLMLSAADRHPKVGLERLPKIRVAPRWFLQPEPDLKLVSKRSPYMRTER